MAKHGTLPEFIYQRHLEVGDKMHLNFGFHEDEDLNEDEACEEANDSDEGQNEFGESSDEDVDISTDADNNPHTLRAEPGGVLPKKLGRGVRPASQNPYPIYDQNLRF